MAWGTGLRGISAPRMFISQAILSGSVIRAAAWPSVSSASASRVRFSALVSPASASGWAKNGAVGGAGRPVQTPSTGLAMGCSVIPVPDRAFGQFLDLFDCVEPRVVTDHGIGGGKVLEPV